MAIESMVALGLATAFLVGFAWLSKRNKRAFEMKLDDLLPAGTIVVFALIAFAQVGNRVSEVVLTQEGCLVATDLGINTKPTESKNCTVSEEGMKLWNDVLRFEAGKRIPGRYLAAWTYR